MGIDDRDPAAGDDTCVVNLMAAMVAQRGELIGCCANCAIGGAASSRLCSADALGCMVDACGDLPTLSMEPLRAVAELKPSCPGAFHLKL